MRGLSQTNHEVIANHIFIVKVEGDGQASSLLVIQRENNNSSTDQGKIINSSINTSGVSTFPNNNATPMSSSSAIKVQGQPIGLLTQINGQQAS